MFVKIIFSTVLVYLLLLALLFVMQRSMIFFPSPVKPDVTPYKAQGVFEIVTKTEDSISLTGWMRQPDEGKGVIVFFHGNASNIEQLLYKAAPYAQAGYGFLLAGYRGYSGNDGKPSEQGFYSDARAWINAVKALGVVEEDIILYGESIGTGVAVQIASEYKKVAALILESPYTSLPDVAAKRFFFVPVRLLMKDKFDSLSKIENVSAPLLIMQGTEDNIIPPLLGKVLLGAANEPKQIYRLKGYGHNDMPDNLKFSATLKFLNSL